jgi:hypothetical protein
MALKEDVRQLFKASCDNLEWFGENYDRLKKEYNGKWVVVQDKRVVASSESYETVLDSLMGCDRRIALIEYMQMEQVYLMF